MLFNSLQMIFNYFYVMQTKVPADNKWSQSIKNFEIFLRLEKSLSENSIEAYLDDVHKLERFFSETGKPVSPENVSYADLKEFLAWFTAENQNARTQSRILSGIRAFFKLDKR